MAGFKLRQLTGLMLLTVLSLFCSYSFAEVRVIVEYDNTEHRLLRVVELASKAAAPKSDHLQANANDEPAFFSSASKVKLLWFSADGMLVSSAVIDDPRLTHAPLTSSGQSPSVVALSEGAYMVSGPTESAVLEIHMPANVALGLDQQVWRMMLVR